MVNLCAMLAKSGKLGNVRTPESAMAIALQAAELGIPPMTGFNNLYQVNGKLGISASLMQALVMRDIPGVKFSFNETPESCTVTLTRPGWDPYVSTFTLADAKKAGLVKPDSNWVKYPQNMMRSRALANACRTMAPEVLAGMYAPEELGDTEINIQPMMTTTVDASTETNGHAEPEDSGVIDAEPVEAESVQAVTNGTNGKHAEPATESAATPNTGHPATKAATPQLLELKRLKKQLEINDQRWKDTLAAYKVTTALDLTGEQANNLISILRKREAIAKDETVASGN
mgnify:FL=1